MRVEYGGIRGTFKACFELKDFNAEELENLGRSVVTLLVTTDAINWNGKLEAFKAFLMEAAKP